MVPVPNSRLTTCVQIIIESMQLFNLILLNILFSFLFQMFEEMLSCMADLNKPAYIPYYSDTTVSSSTYEENRLV